MVTVYGARGTAEAMIARIRRMHDRIASSTPAGKAYRELVDGYRADEMSSSARGQVLIPWPNRLQDGRYEFDGRRHQLPLNEPEHRNAIHGLVRWAAWTTAEREPDRAVMEHVLHPQPGYPFSLRISIEYALTDSGLRVRTTARNLGTDPCPYGGGAHPYLTLGTAAIDR
jgi:aldose 1-epimerase